MQLDNRRSAFPALISSEANPLAQLASDAFFYGTLMHPKILKRVINNDGSHLQLCPAILLDYTRHRIKHAVYPGVIPFTKSEPLFKRELSQEEKSVRGMLVTGLTEKDMVSLDIFEGDEYTRESIKAHPLEEFRNINSHVIDESTLPVHPPSLPSATNLAPILPAETYIYGNINALEDQLWSYEDFVRQHAWEWYGSAADSNKDITEVDRRREAGERQR